MDAAALAAAIPQASRVRAAFFNASLTTLLNAIHMGRQRKLPGDWAGMV
jgi:hypothetical protein